MNEEKICEMHEVAWFIPDKLVEFLTYAKERLDRDDKLSKLIRAKEVKGASIGVDLLVKESATKVLELIVEEYDYDFTREECRQYFEQVEDLEVLRFKSILLEELKGYEGTDKNVLDELKRINDMRVRREEEKFEVL